MGIDSLMAFRQSTYMRRGEGRMGNLLDELIQLPRRDGGLVARQVNSERVVDLAQLFLD
jgi:hypothetical protein